MKKNGIRIGSLILVFFLFLMTAKSSFGNGSKFLEAHIGATLLDLELASMRATLNWALWTDELAQRFFGDYPLIIKMKPLIEHLKHNSSEDRIELCIRIFNEVAFFKLSAHQRKALLKSFLEWIMMRLPVVVSYERLDKLFHTEDLRIVVRLMSSHYSTFIRIQGIYGNAGFVNNRVIYSEKYYLNCKKIEDISEVKRKEDK